MTALSIRNIINFSSQYMIDFFSLTSNISITSLFHSVHSVQNPDIRFQSMDSNTMSRQEGPPSYYSATAQISSQAGEHHLHHHHHHYHRRPSTASGSSTSTTSSSEEPTAAEPTTAFARKPALRSKYARDLECYGLRSTYV